MKRGLKICALTAVLGALALSSYSSSAAEVLYRWKDQRGNPVHSDRPPPEGVDYEVISTGSNMVRPVDGDVGAVPLKVKPTPSNDFDPVDTEKPRIEKNPEYCQRARDNLESLDSGVRIRMRNEQGEVRDLSDEDRETERQKAISSIEAHCE